MCDRYRQWVRDQGWIWERAAAEIGAPNASTARGYAHGVIPRREAMLRIYLRSGGYVRPDHFYDLPPLDGAARSEAEAA